jgi:hypothetical protein
MGIVCVVHALFGCLWQFSVCLLFFLCGQKYYVSGMALFGEISAPWKLDNGKFVYVSNINTRQKHALACHSNRHNGLASVMFE